MKAVNEINHYIGIELELKKVCDLVVKKINEIINCDACAILLLEDEKIVIPSEIGFKNALGDVQFTIETPAINYIFSTKKRIISGNISKSDFVSCVPQGCSMTSLLCEPILSEGNVRGIIHLDSCMENAFTEEDENFITILANEVSLAIRRALDFEKIRSLSIVDKLTNTFNRRKFDTDIEDEFNKALRYKRNLSLLMIDIDWFKKYNDMHGHIYGDNLLSKTGEIFKDNLRNTDKVYRYGGEEFAIICCETDLESAGILSERLCVAIANYIFDGASQSQPEGRITISVGYSSFPENSDSKIELVRKADDALYSSKNNGRNRATASIS